MRNSLSLSISVFSTVAIVVIAGAATFTVSHILSESTWLAQPKNIMVGISRVVWIGVIVFSVVLMLLGKIMLEFTSARNMFNLNYEFSRFYFSSKPIGQKASWIGTSICFVVLLAAFQPFVYPQQVAILSLPIFDALLFIFVLAIIGQIAEEIFFRGWIWSIYSMYLSSINADIVATLLWLIAHAVFDPQGLPFLAILGLIIYINRLKRATILTTSLIHIFYNMFVVLAKLQ